MGVVAVEKIKQRRDGFGCVASGFISFVLAGFASGRKSGAAAVVI